MSELVNDTPKKQDVLNIVKFRCGAFYSNELIDNDFKAMLLECEEHLLLSGVSREQLESSPLAVSAYTLWCKMARSSSAESVTNHPVLLSYIIQMRDKRGLQS